MEESVSPVPGLYKKPEYKNNRKNLEQGEQTKCVSKTIFLKANTIVFTDSSAPFIRTSFTPVGMTGIKSPIQNITYF